MTRSIGYLLLAVGAIVIVVCCVCLLVVAYRASVGWLLISLFIPFGGLFFVLMHWDDSKKFVGWQFLVAMPLILGGIYLAPH